VTRTHNDAFGRLLKRCAGLVTCAIAHPCDRDSLLGPIEAAKRGLIVPVLVGPEAKIRAVAVAEKVDLASYRIVATEHGHDSRGYPSPLWYGCISA
jgi:phosphate acetyltransferase